MGYRLTFVEEHQYIILTLAGVAILDELEQARQELNTALITRGWNKAFVDVTGQTTKLSITQDYDFTKNMPLNRTADRKTATLTRPDQLEEFRFHEDVAQNRGVNLHIFSDKQAALDWLLSE